VITKHISNVFQEGELDEKSNVHFLHIPNSDKPVKFYSLDVSPPPRIKTPFLPKGSFYCPPMADADEMVLAKKKCTFAASNLINNSNDIQSVRRNVPTAQRAKCND
jgi:hypothetical protein